ncbi:MAG: preprotein translocase subunit SecG [Nitrospinae bacterium]|nr:preprotein translocase subunit SecG [Nitrospinota bacterium]
MSVFLTVVHILAAVSLILFVLLQAGKGGGIGAAFGGGSSDTLFGSSGPDGILGKLTTGAAILFMATSLLLSFFGARSQTGSLVPDAPVRPLTQSSTPAKPGAAAPQQSPETGKPGS